MDAKGRYHKQLCLHSRDSNLFGKISAFLEAESYCVSGGWANEFIASMQEYVSPQATLNLVPTCSASRIAGCIGEKVVLQGKSSSDGGGYVVKDAVQKHYGDAT